jgi:2-succinyl-6-hydroxy-2,4-cyclohexadiene-1-carboxylate synthase
MTRVEVRDGVGYAVREVGEGEPVLLLHGFTGSGAGWTTVLPTLAHDHRLIAVDLLGHGGSDAPAPERHALERQAADLAEILRRLDAAPANVLGYSFGARVALRLAIDSPTSVSALVLESPSAGILDVALRAARRDADLRWVEQLQRGDLAGFVRDWVAQPIFASQARMPGETRDRATVERLANRPTGLAASLLGAGQGVMTPLHDRLRDITVPTLVVSGRLDARGMERAAEVAAGIPGSTHAVIDDAGHTPHLERPERFRDVVTSFLATPLATPIPTLAP